MRKRTEPTFQYEKFESRRLLASISFDAGAVVIHGTANDDLIELIGNADQSLTVRINNDPSLTETFRYEDISQLTVFSGDGNDRVTNTLLHDSEIHGGDGDDTIQGGFRDDLLYGGDGDDTLIGRTGNDTLYGEVGIDLLYGGQGEDRLFGSDGNDRLFGGNGDDQLFGGNGDDLLAGNSGTDQLYGNAGEDRIYAGSGDDIVNGGFGDDAIYGTSGANTLNGNGDNDQIYGGRDADRLSGGNGDDLLVGNAGADQLEGNSGDDVLVGSAGDDDLSGNSGNDRLEGNEGADNIDAGPGDDIVNGGNGDDVIYGISGTNTLNGNGDDDQIYGGQGADRLFGGNGDDLLEGNAGDDLLVGNAGNDDLSGSSGNDRLEGNEGADTINAGSGDDIANGGSGADTINAGLGNDTVNGGLDDDLILGVDGTNNLNGNDGNDVIHGGNAIDTIDGGSGDDSLFGNAGKDLLFGNAGVDSLFGGLDDDILEGGDGDDFVYGQQGDDELRASFGDDVLNGNTGSDFVRYFSTAADLDVQRDVTGYQVTDLRTPNQANTYGADRLVDIEELAFGEQENQVTQAIEDAISSPIDLAAINGILPDGWSSDFRIVGDDIWIRTVNPNGVPQFEFRLGAAGVIAEVRDASNGESLLAPSFQGEVTDRVVQWTLWEFGQAVRHDVQSLPTFEDRFNTTQAGTFDNVLHGTVDVEIENGQINIWSVVDRNWKSEQDPYIESSISALTQITLLDGGGILVRRVIRIGEIRLRGDEVSLEDPYFEAWTPLSDSAFNAVALSIDGNGNPNQTFIDGRTIPTYPEIPVAETRGWATGFDRFNTSSGNNFSIVFGTDRGTVFHADGSQTSNHRYTLNSLDFNGGFAILPGLAPGSLDEGAIIEQHLILLPGQTINAGTGAQLDALAEQLPPPRIFQAGAVPSDDLGGITERLSTLANEQSTATENLAGLL